VSIEEGGLEIEIRKRIRGQNPKREKYIQVEGCGMAVW